MVERIELHVLGIMNYVKNQPDIYLLLLEEIGGERCMPVLTYISEAQYVLLLKEKVEYPRPLPHDIYVQTVMALGAKIREVFIDEFNDGVFTAHIILLQTDGNEVRIVARASDAITIAMRANAPIYTTLQIFERASLEMHSFFDFDFDTDASVYKTFPKMRGIQKELIIKMDTGVLNDLMEEAVEQEDYALASMLRDELKRRNEL